VEYKFSIITVVLNGGKTIEYTIQSVIGQHYKNLEYIVIDGGSSDNTTEIIKKYENSISFWKSEKDKGIYDAMNKGLLKATGDIILFLNADDYFIDYNILSEVNKSFIQKPNCKLIYGKVRWQFFNPDYTIDYSGNLSLRGLKRGEMIFQASTFMKKDVFELIGLFDIQYQISGDFDLFCRIVNAKFEYCHTDMVIAMFRSDGKSSNHDLAWKEGAKIIRKYYGKNYALRFFIFKSLELRIKKMLIWMNLINVYRKMKKKIIFANSSK
jgi:glycosyltransferase involved in cell wall biosynthesis